MASNVSIKTGEVQSHDGLEEDHPNYQPAKLGNIWDLEKSDNCQDIDRFKYFIELVIRLTENVSERLEDAQRRDPDKYGERKYLFQFSLDQETEENRRWILFSWPIIYREFKTKDFSRTKQSVRLVGNVLRHVVNWINKHYDLERPILYENKDVWVQDHTQDTTGKGIHKNMSFISF